MHARYPVFLFLIFFASLWAEVVPYTGKLSVDGINFHGRAELSFLEAIKKANLVLVERLRCEPPMSCMTRSSRIRTLKSTPNRTGMIMT